MTAQPDEPETNPVDPAEATEPPEGHPEAPAADPETGEPEPESVSEPEEPEQPAEADPDAGAKVIELRSGTGKGFLTLRPGQTQLDQHQHAALLAIGIDTKNDPGVIPHLRAFMHMCQSKGLDPWAREAYLIGRGKGANRKWTMQTGIDGYRKMAGATKRFIRVAETLWTGPDDDDRSYYRDERGVMRRVWYDQWPASRGNPGAAKVTIEHYDEYGNVTTTEAVADWGMYAPYSDLWEGDKHRRKVIDPDTGKPVQVLNDMWRKGSAFMLSKCAEALADRKAFPAVMAGVYTHEEMGRLDAAERDRQAEEQRKARQAAYRTHQQETAGQITVHENADPVVLGDAVGEVVDGLVVHDAEVVEDGANASAPEVSAAERATMLREELDYQSDVLGHPVATLTRRQVTALRKNVEDFTDEELLVVVAPLRAPVVARLTQSERYAEAVAYAEVAPNEVVRVADITGAPQPPDSAPEIDPEDDPRMDADPTQPHAFINDQGVCALCGLIEDDIIHPG